MMQSDCAGASCQAHQPQHSRWLLSWLVRMLLLQIPTLSGSDIDSGVLRVQSALWTAAQESNMHKDTAVPSSRSVPSTAWFTVRQWQELGLPSSLEVGKFFAVLSACHLTSNSSALTHEESRR